jgi:hypothetical protein
MRKLNYAMMAIGFIGAVGTTAVNIYLGKEFLWPATTAIWIIGAFCQQRVIDMYESRHGIKD